MNKSVPTLLGIVIILLVVVLVVLIYDYKLTSQVVAGGTAVQTTGGRALTGVDAGGEQASPSEVLGTATQPAGEPMPAEKAEKATRAMTLEKLETGEAGGPKAPEGAAGD